MKKLVYLTIVCIGMFFVSQAQTTDSMMSHMKKDCVMMKDGKMMEMKDGKMAMMDHDMTMSNGAMVAKDGTVKMKDGKTMMMKEGQCMYMDGKMSKPMMKKKM